MKRKVWRKRKDGVLQRYTVGKKKTRKKLKKPTIITRDRKIFKHLSNPDRHKIEFGGALDFDKKGKIERIEVLPGHEYSVDLPVDFEVVYHTHPNKRVDLPSPEDIAGFLKAKKQQADIVFRDGNAFIIFRTPDTKKLEKLSQKALEKKILKIWTPAARAGSESAFKKDLEKLGFKVKVSNKKKAPIVLDIKAVQ